jgi:hypothetical protein
MVAIEGIEDATSALTEALSDLNDVRSEYEDWRDNLPENLQGSALGEKLEAVVDLNIESVMEEPLAMWPDMLDVVGEAENIDLPQGFGRD